MPADIWSQKQKHSVDDDTTPWQGKEKLYIPVTINIYITVMLDDWSDIEFEEEKEAVPGNTGDVYREKKTMLLRCLVTVVPVKCNVSNHCQPVLQRRPAHVAIEIKHRLLSKYLKNVAE